MTDHLGGQQSGIEWVDPEPAWPDTPPPLAPRPRRRPDVLRRVRVRTWVAVASVLVVAVAGVGVWYALKPAPPVRITYNGATVDNAEALLTSANSTFLSYAHRHLGITSKQSRCYFERSGTATTDVEPKLFCGPVLFYDGSKDKPYLTFSTTTSTQARPHHVRLSLINQPDSAAPVAATAPLVRPDHRRPPSDAGGLNVPIPPATSPDLLTQVDNGTNGVLLTLNANAEMGSRDLKVDLEGYSYIAHYGSGASERSAAPGHKLIGFSIVLQDGERGPVAKSTPHLGLSIDGGRVRPLRVPPIQGVDFSFIVSVPQDVRSADLVLLDAGFTQHLSVIDGNPAPTNITVLRRYQPYNATTDSGSAVAQVNDGNEIFTAPLKIKVYGESLVFFSPWGAHPSSPKNAFLWVGLCFQSSAFRDPVTCHGFRGTDLVLTPSGGRPVRGRNLARNGRVYPVFEVPGDFSAGTLTVTGSEASGDGWSMTITKPWSDPIQIPS